MLRVGRLVGTPMTDAVTLLTEALAHDLQSTPTLNDAVAVGYAIDPGLCPTTPMSLSVDAAGYTKVEHGSSNAYFCLESDQDRFLAFLMPRLLASSSQIIP
jgi:inosine-uridine nucleoside N-ribohydrolase